MDEVISRNRIMRRRDQEMQKCDEKMETKRERIIIEEEESGGGEGL